MTTMYTRPAEIFHPGKYIQMELNARDWSQSDLAKIVNMNPPALNEVIKGKRSVDASLALALGRAFGTDIEGWLNLQTDYDLWLATANDTNAVERKAKLYEFPVSEMAKRGLVDDTAPLEVLEAQMAPLIDTFRVAAKRSNEGEPLSPGQVAWLHLARRLANSLLDVPKYSKRGLTEALKVLKTFLHAPEETANVSQVLAEAGVRFVVVEGFRGLKLDGACFWLDNSPVVALSLRYDRIDNFWFVLRHELEHVLRGDAKGKDLGSVQPDSLETTMTFKTTSEKERIANEAAAAFCVPRKALIDFIGRRVGYYQKWKIEIFADNQEVHPGLVVGQLHWMGELPYQNLRRTLVKVRSYVTETAFTDGWGSIPQPG